MPTSPSDALMGTGMIPPMSGADLKIPDDAKTEKPAGKTSEQSIVNAGDQGIKDSLKSLDATKPPPPPQFKEAPKLETSDPVGQGYASAIGVMGAIGSIFTRRPMIASMNTAAAVVNAMKQGDQDAFKHNMEKWKIDNENIKAISDYQQAIYKDIFDNKKLDLDTKLALAGSHASAFKDDAMIAHWKNGDIHGAEDLELRREDARHRWEKEAPVAEKYIIENNAKLQRLKMLEEDFKSGTIDRQQMEQELQGLATNKPVQGPTMSKDTLHFLAKQSVDTGMPPPTQMGRQASGAANMASYREEVQRIAKEEGITPATLARKQQEYAANTKGLGSLKVRLANIASAGAALGEVPEGNNPGSGAAKLVVDASKKVPRGTVVQVNKAENEWKMQTSDPKLAQLSVYLDTFAKEYASATNPNGKRTVSDTNKARENLARAINEGHSTLVARVKAMINEKNNSMDQAQKVTNAYLELQGETDSESQEGDKTYPAPEEDHIARLRANPGETELFDEIYGPGAAQKVLEEQ